MKPLAVILVCCLVVPLQAQRKHADFIGAGHHANVKVTASSSSDIPPSGTVDGFVVQNSDQLKDASRFLAQTTFGADLATIHMTAAMGYEAWLTEQFELPYASIVAEMAEQADTDSTDQLYNPWFRAAWTVGSLTSLPLMKKN